MIFVKKKGYSSKFLIVFQNDRRTGGTFVTKMVNFVACQATRTRRTYVWILSAILDVFLAKATALSLIVAPVRRAGWGMTAPNVSVCQVMAQKSPLNYLSESNTKSALLVEGSLVNIKL
jgi:hypothetical protein